MEEDKTIKFKIKCDIDGHYIGYIECFDCWCRHWAKDILEAEE